MCCGMLADGARRSLCRSAAGAAGRRRLPCTFAKRPHVLQALRLLGCLVRGFKAQAGHSMLSRLDAVTHLLCVITRESAECVLCWVLQAVPR
jgi:hypothetical protein